MQQFSILIFIEEAVSFRPVIYVLYSFLSHPITACLCFQLSLSPCCNHPDKPKDTINRIIITVSLSLPMFVFLKRALLFLVLYLALGNSLSSFITRSATINVCLCVYAGVYTHQCEVCQAKPVFWQVFCFINVI